MRIHPFHQTRIYESNTRIFSKTLGIKMGKELAESYLALPEMQVCDYLWTMGIWMPSPASVEIARTHKGLETEFGKALPNLRDEDIIGSPYSIYDYEPNPGLCDSWEDLEIFWKTLKENGKKLILDFVPNHLSVDSPWIDKQPLAFLDCTEEYVEKNLGNNHFLHPSGRIYAHGRDPYFDGWTDTVQFDFSHSACLDLHRQFLDKISDYCDGLRCDMAMLAVGGVFERTHGKPGFQFYWEEMIQATKKKRPDFIFIAEVYWNMEASLQKKGFDLTYDKDLYDHLEHKNTEALAYHLRSDNWYLDHSLQFLENHDEPRANSVFFRDSIPFFALLSCLPGGLLIHEGQTDGCKKKLPVQLGRYPKEDIDRHLQDFYLRAYSVIVGRSPGSIQAYYPDTEIYESSAVDENGQCIVYSVVLESATQQEFMIFNLTNRELSGRIHLDSDWIQEKFPGKTLVWDDAVLDKSFSQPKDEVLKYGFYFKLDGFHAHWFHRKKS